MKECKVRENIVEHWRTKLSPEEKKQRYLESIPEQVHASMTFEGEPVSIEILREYLEALTAKH
jgi:hypothetical protein